MRYLNQLICLMFLLSLISCSDDPKDEVENKSPLLIINFDQHYLVDDNLGYVVITDSTGQVLNTTPIANGQTASMVPSESYQGSTINFYIIVYNESASRVNAFLNIKRGITWDFSIKPLGGGFQDPIKINMKNASDFDYLSYGTDAMAYTLYGSFLDTATYSTQFSYREGGKVYAQRVKNEQGMFQFFPISNDKKVYDIDFSALSGTSLTKTISVPDNDWGRFSLRADSDTNDGTYFLFDRTFNGPSFKIYYPDVTFPKYYTSINLIDGEKHISYTAIGSIPLTYAAPGMDAELLDPNPGQFQAQFVGDFDYYVIEFADTVNKNSINVTASRFSDHFAIPDFSKIIPTRPLVFTNFHPVYLSLGDLENFSETKDHFEYYSTYPPANYPEKVVTWNF